MRENILPPFCPLPVRESERKRGSECAYACCACVCACVLREREREREGERERGREGGRERPVTQMRSNLNKETKFIFEAIFVTIQYTLRG